MSDSWTVLCVIMTLGDEGYCCVMHVKQKKKWDSFHSRGRKKTGAQPCRVIGRVVTRDLGKWDWEP